MNKHKILGYLNVLLSIFFITVLVTSSYSKAPLISITSFIHEYAPSGIILFLIITNAFLAYHLLIKKNNKLPMTLYVVLTFSTVFWFVLLFVGYFFASNIAFPIVSLTLGISMLYLLRKSSKKIAIVLSILTLLVSVVVIDSGFEEDYCWEKGAQADSTGSKFITATKEDVLALNDFDIKEGSQIGIRLKEHMLCHSSFNFEDALKEKYLFIK